jgi:hypothetical protein
MSGSIIHQCPGCERLLTFAHEKLNYTCCPYCHTVSLRLDGGILIKKPLLPVKEAPEPIQPGTRGQWQGQRFEVTGRWRMWTDTGVFNYWTIVFDNNTLSILAEGYGLFAVYEQDSAFAISAERLDKTSGGKMITLGKEGSFFVTNQDESLRWEIEGSVNKPLSDTIETFEAASEEGIVLAMLLFGRDIAWTFRVHYTTPETLQLENLRPAPVNSKTTECPSCKQAVVLKGWPFVQLVVCPSCNTKLECTQAGNWIRRNVQQERPAPLIPLGTHLQFYDVDYEVTGRVIKEENNTDKARWQETVLYNPLHGFAFLSMYDGHWMFVKERGNFPSHKNPGPQEIWSNGKDFHIFNAYSFSVVTAEGAFPNNIYKDDFRVNVREYIAPPEMWIIERHGDKTMQGFHATYIKRSYLDRQLNGEVYLPSVQGIGAAQPVAHLSKTQLILGAFVACFICICVHFGIAALQSNRTVVSQHLQFDSSDTKTYVTQSFKLDKWRSNLQVEIQAPVDNSWFSLESTLVSSTGDEYGVEQGVEYYHGYTDGENWSEGKTNETVYFSSVPSGTYVLQLKGQREANPAARLSARPEYFEVIVTNDAPMTKNLVVVLLLVLVWPVCFYFYIHYCERKRWYHSPFTTYTYNE